jgi:hypothetical protein
MDTATQARESLLASHLLDARNRLIQTGTRNRLVHAARFAKRGKAIDIVDERTEDCFHILVRNGRRMRFAPDANARDTADADEPLLLAAPRKAAEARYTDLVLQTQFGPDRLAKKLLGLAREARTLEEEQGINALYLAFGFLRWYEDEKSEIVREAPLVLVPVSLERNDRTSSYELEARDEEIATNEPLAHRLNDDFGIKLPEIPEGETWTPGEYFSAVSAAISGQVRWSIDADGMQLGFFSFAKLLMVKDLEPESWPGDSPLDHPILARLLVDGFGDTAGNADDDYPEGANLDELFSPGDLVQILDADASQTLVIKAVRSGRNLVVQGPPGTGKSQTITNIIAAAVHDGKSVLFVAEKMAALNVVHDRLKRAGLQDICLELHSRSANKRQVVDMLGQTLGAAATRRAGDNDIEELTRLRDRLNAVADAMHRPIGNSDITPYRAISTLIRLKDAGFRPPDLTIPGVADWTRAQLDGALKSAKALADATARAGARSTHPLVGIGRIDLLPTDRERLRPRLEALLAALRQAEKWVGSLARQLGLKQAASPASSAGVAGLIEHIATLSGEAAPFAAAIAQHGGADRARALVAVGNQFEDARWKWAAKFSPAAIGARIEHLRPMLATGHSFFGRLRGPYRSASAELASLLNGPLPKSQPDRLSLLDHLAELKQAAKRLESQASAGTELLGGLWQGETTDFRALAEASAWIDRLLTLAVGANVPGAVRLREHEPDELRSAGSQLSGQATQARALAEEVCTTLKVDLPLLFDARTVDAVPFDRLAARAELWLNNLDRLDEWSQLSLADAALRGLAGDAVADAVADATVPPDQLGSTIRYVHAETLYRQFAAEAAWATRLTAAEKAELIGAFREREKTRRTAVARLIRADHLDRIPRGGMGAMGLVRAEIGRRRGHKPIRKLMSEAGSVIQQIKPVLLMSPISVAQFLPPGAISFDLLVIDEASQVRPEDAFGAIARARQIVVVGDKKQLPPTSFFDRIVADEDEEADEAENGNAAPAVTRATELESVLTLCEARGLRSRMLRWHYRSRHPSLIEVSNELFYQEQGGLVLFPSPSATTDTDGLVVRRLNGAYDRGGKRHNVIEAEAVARAAAEHAKARPDRSLGIVTFSTAQRDQVTFWLDKLRQDDEALDVFMREGRGEAHFVKNIENVQGDERDVIFISVGYGPRIAGARLDSMAFGPVSTEGGERRLNVLFTRARFRTEVFVSFNSGDIDLERTRSVGARALKRYLQFAEIGITHAPVALDADPDSDFEVAVANEIRSLGYEVDYQVGSAGFKIDLAIRDPARPGRYMLAIECDGATYHSALWARERDRLRQEILEGLGWRFHRVWSTDWFHRRPDEVRRLQLALRAAEEQPPEIIEEIDPIDDEGTKMEPEIDGPPVEVTAAATLPDYVVADFPVPARVEPHTVSIRDMAPICRRVIEIEGPVHIEEIARRVAALFGKQKAGSRIVANVEASLRYLASTSPEIVTEDGFWMTAGQQAPCPLRNRSRAPLSLRKASMIPPIEIACAIRAVLNQNGALSWDELPRAVALLFGFLRTGPEFRPVVLPVIERLVHEGELIEGPAGLQLGKAQTLPSA